MHSKLTRLRHGGRQFLAAALATCASAALASAAWAAAPVLNAPADIQAITTIENALATESDMSKLITYYAPTAFVADMVAPGIYQGRAQIRDSFAKQFAAMQSMQGHILDMNTVSDGRFACAALRVAFASTMKDGSKLNLSLRQLDAFKKIGDKWQIVQEHISVPEDAKTTMAATNLTLPVRGAIDWPANLLAGPATTPAKADAEIRQWLVTGAPVVDVNDMLTYFGPDATVLLYDLTAPGEYRGLKEMHDAYAPLMNSLSGAKDELLKFVVDSDGVLGVQIDTQNLRIDFKNGTSKIISFRQSDCMHRVDGKWKSMLEMLSFPLDTKTGKSVTQDPAAFK